MEILYPFDIKLENTNLIEASAGTGKTYTITIIYTRLVLEGYNPASILVVTFTEAAAAELKIRIRKMLLDVLSFAEGTNTPGLDETFKSFFKGNNSKSMIQKRALLKNAILMFDQASILTIHSFCLKMLKENAFECRALFDIELSADSSLVEKDICFDFFAQRINNLDPLFLQYLKKRNFVPEKLIKKFSKILSRPDIALVPETMEFVDVFDEYRDVVKRISDYVDNKSFEIKDFINNNKGINKQSYRKNSVVNWLEQISQQLLDTGENTVFKMDEKGDSLYKFTLTRLEQKIKPGFDLPEYQFFDLCQKLLELSLVFENNILSLELAYLKYLKLKLAKTKEKHGNVFFNDLINDLAHALHDTPGNTSSNKLLISAIQDKYHGVLIDEFQDTDQTQYSIFSKLFANKSLFFCMIGDPKQAIYGFRGGDIFAYLKAVTESKKIYTLDRNYRSDPQLVEAVNSVFTAQTNPFLYEKIGFYPVKTPETSRDRLSQDGNESNCFRFLFLKIKKTNADLDKQGFIKKTWANDNIPLIAAEDIAKLLSSSTLLENKKIEPSDIAVIVRKNYQAEKISKALKIYQIDSHIYSSDSLFNSKEAIEMTDLLWAVLEPEDAGLIKAALLTNIFEFNGNDIDDFKKNNKAFAVWQERFKEYRALWQNHGFIRLIQAIFYSEQAFSKDKTSLTKRTLTNYNHLIELLHYAEIDQHLSPAFLIKWFIHEQARALDNSSLEELRLESDQKAVSIVTIHKSKGLEWPIVYLPYLWDAKPETKDDYCLYHDPDDEYKEKFDLGSINLAKARELTFKETKAEDQRLLYVALTRAASMVNIIWGRINKIGSSALGSILHNNSGGDDDDMIRDIQSLADNGASGINIDFYEYADSCDFFENNPRAAYDNQVNEIKTLTRSIFQVWKIASFSSLISGVEYKFLNKGEPGEDLLVRSEITLIDFPTGAGSGDFFHSIFEDLDFQDTQENIAQLVLLKLEKFGYNPQFWEKIINTAVKQILSTRLLSTELLPEEGDLALENISACKRLNELEFFFLIKSIDNKKLYKIFKKYMKLSSFSKYADQLLELTFESISGFMKGFIDLVFEHNNRWYIVDYKSNFLGKSYDDYSCDAMNDSMMEHHYFLQYHIYVVALHKYLMFCKKDYDYNTHFGGVFYLFIRGMKHSKTGVFFHRPAFEFIHELSNNFF